MNNENPVIEEITENTDDTSVEENVEGIELTDTSEVEEPTEETKEEVKTYTEEELEERLQKRLARQKLKLERDYQQELSKYKQTESILNTGLGTNSIDEATKKLADYYRSEGINIPETVNPGLTPRQVEILANAEAQEIIDLGIDEVNAELRKFDQKEVSNMTDSEKVIFKRLYEEATSNNRKENLKKSGIDVSILDNKDFQSFENKFNNKTDVLEIVNMFNKLNSEKTQPPAKIGSMAEKKPEVFKSYYTPEEVRSLTNKELDDPRIMKAVEDSMTKWEQEKNKK